MLGCKNGIVLKRFYCTQTSFRISNSRLFQRRLLLLVYTLLYPFFSKFVVPFSIIPVLLKCLDNPSSPSACTALPLPIFFKLSRINISQQPVANTVAGTFTSIAIQLYFLQEKASPPKKMAATIRVPRSRAKLVLMEMSAKPQIIVAYAKPITKGTLVEETKGFAGSRAAQITTPQVERVSQAVQESVHKCLRVQILKAYLVERRGNLGWARKLTIKLSTKNSIRNRLRLLWFGPGNVQRMLAGPPSYTRPFPAAREAALKAAICS